MTSTKKLSGGARRVALIRAADAGQFEDFSLPVTLYLVRLERPYIDPEGKHPPCNYYRGSKKDNPDGTLGSVTERVVAMHATGRGAAFLRAVVAEGIRFAVVATHTHNGDGSRCTMRDEMRWKGSHAERFDPYAVKQDDGSYKLLPVPKRLLVKLDPKDIARARQIVADNRKVRAGR